MLIRLTQNSEGIEHYFATGKKVGRNFTRDELDQRVILWGNLDAFSCAVAYTTQHKKNWNAQYWHITASFAAENNDLDNETLTEITLDLLRYYFPAYNPDDLIVAAEAHRPKIQSETNQTTGEVYQRLLHLHLAVSKLDTKTNNQVRIVPFKKKADAAFQSYLAEKYHLVDPAQRQRALPKTKADFIRRWRKESTLVSKQTQVAELRNALSVYLKDVSSINDAIAQLKKLDYVASVTFKVQKSGNRYLQVRTKLETRDINLRGKGFEVLETLYYSAEELAARQQGNKSPQSASVDHKAIYEAYQNWWLKEEAKRRPSPQIDFNTLHARYVNRFNPILEKERRYYVLDKQQISEISIQGYTIFEKHNTHYLYHHALSVKIYDMPDKIVAEIPDDPTVRTQVVALMLQLALAKGWQLDNIVAHGTPEFIKEVQQKIAALTLRNTPLAPEFINSVRKPQQRLSKEHHLNLIDQLVTEHHQTDAAARSREAVEKLKIELDAQRVIEFAAHKFGLKAQHYTVTHDNKIKDDRLSSMPRSTIDFLTKTCNIAFKDALSALDELLEQQHIDKDEVNDDAIRPK